MSDEEAPPDSVPPESPRPRGVPTNKDGRRRRLEGVIPEIVRRAVELGVEKAQEAPDTLKQLIADLKLPKEIAHYLLVQVDETKNGLFRVVAKEIRDFLEHTNFAGEVQKMLTTVQFEVNTTIRFSPNDGPKKKSKKSADGAELKTGESAAGSAGSAGDEPVTAEPRDRRTPLPRPEVKTSVHVRRDERDDDELSDRRDRDT